MGEPGGDWNYSNAGYILLGRIVENVSHENYFDYIQHHVFAPAGMTDSGFDAQEDVTPKLATGYFHDGAFSTDWKANWMTLPFKGSPAGGGYSTNADLLRFAKALRDAKLVKRETLAKMKGQQTRSVADADEFVSTHERRLQARPCMISVIWRGWLSIASPTHSNRSIPQRHSIRRAGKPT